MMFLGTRNFTSFRRVKQVFSCGMSLRQVCPGLHLSPTWPALLSTVTPPAEQPGRPPTFFQPYIFYGLSGQPALVSYESTCPWPAIFSGDIVTLKERTDNIMDKFKRLGCKRYSNAIKAPDKKKEHTVTLTNNIRDIEGIAYDVLHHVDRKEYEQAHCMLDNLERHIHEVRRHIDHLQNVRDFCARPAGD